MISVVASTAAKLSSFNQDCEGPQSQKYLLSDYLAP